MPDPNNQSNTENKTTLKNKYAYIVTIPDPENSLGIERQVELNDPIQAGYVFWIKVGDSNNPWKRVKDYHNPDQGVAVIAFKDEEAKEASKFSEPIGEQIEAKVLQQLEGGSIEQMSTEWHALYTSKEKAEDLRVALIDLLGTFNKEGKLEKESTYEEVVKAIEKVKEHTTNEGKIPEFIWPKNPMIYILVVPSVHELAYNKGYSNTTANPSTHSYYVRINGSNTKDSTPRDFVASRFLTETPDCSYNAFPVRAEDKGDGLAIVRKYLSHKIWEEVFQGSDKDFTDLFSLGKSGDWCRIQLDGKRVELGIKVLREFVATFHETNQGKLDDMSSETERIAEEIKLSDIKKKKVHNENE